MAKDSVVVGPGLYRTDAFHRSPLFAVRPSGHALDKPPLVVRSWDDAYTLHGPLRIDDINPAWLGCFITETITADLSPYKRIQRLPRANHVCIHPDGAVHTVAYDPLAGGAEPMGPDLLKLFIRAGMLNHLRGCLQGIEGAIGCEHSSGIDSNAVIGGLIHGLDISPNRIHTWSLDDDGEGELLEEFRSFYGLLPSQVHSFGVKTVALSSKYNKPPLELLRAPIQMGGMEAAVKSLCAAGVSVIFSGFGGDQALSHNAANVPTDLVAQGRWRELATWCGSRRLTLKTGIDRTLALLSRRWSMDKVMAKTKDFCRSDLLTRSLTHEGRRVLGAHLGKDYPWEIDNYVGQQQSVRQRVLADWVAVRAEEESRIAAAYDIRKFFPLLDETLIATLLQQDPVVFGERVGRGRLVARKAFEPFLPPFLVANPTKARILEEGWEDNLRQELRRVLEAGLEVLNQLHPFLAHWWQLEVIRREAEGAIELPDSSIKDLLGICRSLDTLKTLSAWTEMLD